MSEPQKKGCGRNADDCIEGDQIYISCQITGKWKLIQKSGQHKGSSCTVKKDATAKILKSYTNVKQN